MLDPDAQAVIDLIKATGRPPIHTMTPEEARQAYRRAGDVFGPEPQAVAEVRDLKAGGPADDIPLRLYRGAGTAAGQALPCLIFFHGGGWVIGDLDTHDRSVREICRGSRAVVVAVDYRLAPEHPFPAAAEDAVAAARWIAAHRGELGGDDRLAVAGDSAGGNLAAVVAQQLIAEGTPPAAQLLVYPAVDALGDRPSRTENARGYFLEQATMDWFYGHYAGAWNDAKDPRLSPLHAADLSGLPPAVLVTAEYDPLRDEGEAYGEALRAAGVEARVRRFDGLIHGFFAMGAVSPAAQAAVDETCAAFGELLHR
jgi:acetyl esterase